ncbi:MAG TPA: prolipoprotein diacylglyceryl transferase [Polyangiaceae bacterium]|jgi:phosphatidylglycerol:prolipoprotein diacylglycerol transferase|nr:prolipoprotein diacylglyceryl transferase [Polyangiaceae bacterium]
MHPVLFKIPLPAWALPLGPTLFVLAGLGLLLAVFGRRKGALDLLVIGVLALGCGLVGGFLFRGQSFTLESLPIYSYGALLCVSIVVGWFLSLGLGARDGLPRELLANCYFITAIAALVGSRVLYVLTNLGEFHGLLDMLAVRRGGLVAYGGFMGGFAGSFWYLRKRGVALLPWADVAVPSLASGLLFTRIGCYLFGCDFGKPLAADAPLWLKRLGTFPRWSSDVLDGAGSPAWLQHVNERGLSITSQASLPVHPTELYESLVGCVLFVLTLWLMKRRRFRGEAFFAFTFGYGYLRFLLEIVRDDSERGTFGPAFREHVLIPVLLVLFAAAFAYGPARSIVNGVVRRVCVGFAFAVPVLVYAALRPSPTGGANVVQLSTSQWISLVTALVVAFAWHQREALTEREPSVALQPALASTDTSSAPDAMPAASRRPPKNLSKRGKKRKR